MRFIIHKGTKCPVCKSKRGLFEFWVAEGIFLKGLTIRGTSLLTCLNCSAYFEKFNGHLTHLKKGKVFQWK
jgi:hypothetical protein